VCVGVCVVSVCALGTYIHITKAYTHDDINLPAAVCACRLCISVCV